MSLRQAIREASPDRLRVAMALARRAWRDARLLGPRRRLVSRGETPAAGFEHRIVEVVQEIKKTAFLEGKLVNIRLGAERLDGVVLAPGEIFSFWKLVGPPKASAGFEVGRSIRGGLVSGDVGGGLCQVSGIAYEVGLRAGLEVVERYPHSRDLYAEEDRFTPLGMDATVVWPYKDLRFANPLPVPVQVRMAVRDLTITASVHAPVTVPAAPLEIERTDHDGWRAVRIQRLGADGTGSLISDDVYPVMLS
jgi:vancomycin resistance protein VanW